MREQTLVLALKQFEVIRGAAQAASALGLPPPVMIVRQKSDKIGEEQGWGFRQGWLSDDGKSFKGLVVEPRPEKQRRSSPGEVRSFIFMDVDLIESVEMEAIEGTSEQD